MIVAEGRSDQLPEAIDDRRLARELGIWNTQPHNIPNLLEPDIQTIKLHDIFKFVLDQEELQGSTDNCLDIQSLLSLDTILMEWRDKLPHYLQYALSSDHSASVESNTTRELGIAPVDFSAHAARLYTRYRKNNSIFPLRPELIVSQILADSSFNSASYT